MEDDRATTAIWKLEIFWWQAQLKATGLQLQSGNSRFLGAVQLEDDRATTAIWKLEIGPVEGNRATTAIWELEIFGSGPVGRRQG